MTEKMDQRTHRHDQPASGGPMTRTSALEASVGSERQVLLAFLNEHRRLIRDKVMELTDEEARRRLVPSLPQWVC